MSRMEIAIPAPVGVDFDFNDARPLPFLSAPSTPKRFGDFSLSAPASPSRVAELYRYFDGFDEDKQPKSPEGGSGTGKEDDFSFDFSAELEKSSLPAEELFDGGKIRPVKPLLEDDDVDSLSQKSQLLSPRSPRSPKDIIRGVFSPRRKKDSDPFASIAVEKTQKKTENERGRERGSGLTSSSCRRATRSLSPYRVAQYPWEEEEKVQQPPQSTNQSSSALTANKASTSSSSSSSKGSSKRWRLKDLLLFRSASEGRASDKDPFRKYSALFRKHEGAKNASFRSADGGSGSSKRRGQVSPHELHYTVNKAVSEDLKKRTFLPYKQGILGRLAFNPAVHALANGFGSFAR